mmetsp:Transcript_28811/g.62218  ORF Transcript_28811/g.62218 Transcript_28811/m.62218 type:complete len:211 (+) Transcript_28811:323-955(+)
MTEGDEGLYVVPVCLRGSVVPTHRTQHLRQKHHSKSGVVESLSRFTGGDSETNVVRHPTHRAGDETRVQTVHNKDKVILVGLQRHHAVNKLSCLSRGRQAAHPQQIHPTHAGDGQTNMHQCLVLDSSQWLILRRQRPKAAARLLVLQQTMRRRLRSNIVSACDGSTVQDHGVEVRSVRCGQTRCHVLGRRKEFARLSVLRQRVEDKPCLD